MSNISIVQFPVLSDNYIHLMCNDKTKEALVVDPSIGPAPTVLEYIKKHNITVKYILNTHHHWDHTGGNQSLQEETGAKIIGYSGDAHRIPSLNTTVEDVEEIELLGCKARVIFIPGHTLGHIAYHFYEENILFCGDTLFAMGCGRLFEGTPEQMHISLSKLASLPAATQIYCGHEYTEHNGEFALTIEPNNQDLVKRMEEVRAIRAKNESTLPSLVSIELKTNPFFRADSDEIRQNLKLTDATDLEVFTKIRELKDRF